ncbi:ABC transporter permease [Sphingomonas sanguinis]|jgi:putative ABC transport system permease protein|uniref:ABC transporter permease n=1 Tax=Sphingomonas sanguinis TaxID=33051 RepID=A0A7Y7QYS7_9SPHN|nr:ABC transporter permease [Sphingomonas sanguinis]MBZ6383946.1 ABC transporter permease [Sphingomonas sanguinis]NNG50678.1 FtsX-like permease family protein [Sphingomonas sanguinis]NNG52803.1 FtsX-like permease family protein [Sphingomonas sanguinis]NVP33237.1 ABC transporter permease [Sphingomonas sanguinis]
MSFPASALLSFYRSLTRHRLFALLNIGGLALGIAVFLVLFLYVRFETGYDRFMPGADKLYIIQERYFMPGLSDTPSPYTMGGEWTHLKADYPNLVGTRLFQRNAIVHQGNNVTSEALAAVDANFFALLRFPAISGDPVKALADPDAAVITQEVAAKYFGSEPAIGRTITFAVEDKMLTYRVGAVIENMRDDSSVQDDIYVQLVPARFANEWFEHWGSTSLTTILRFPDAAAAHAFEGELGEFAKRHVFAAGDIKPGQWQQSLRPLVDNHLYDPADRAAVTTLGVVGLLTLVIAIVNYVNLATARSGLRAREVAIRKVLGGTRAALMRQFMTEAVATVALAAVLGLALAELSLPLVNAAGGTTLAVHYLGAGSILPPLLLMVLTVGLVAGIYPALVLARFQPSAVLASARAPGGGRAGARLRAALVVGQFAIAIAFGISTATMLAQAAHVRDADLGFQRDSLFIVHSFEFVDDAQRADVLRALAALPGVSSVTSAQNAPGSQDMTNNTVMYLAGKPESSGRSMMHVATGDRYFETFGARLIAGRLFDRARPADDFSVHQRGSKTPYGVVINRTAAADLGFSDPATAIGKTMLGNGTQTIIGVVDDLRFRGPREVVGGIVYRYESKPFPSAFAIVRYSGAPHAFRDAVEAMWKRVAPAVPFGGRSVEENLYRAYYQQDAQRANLFTIGAVLAVLIGCIGLYGLAAFDTARRIKEIGIRKTLGASTADVLRLLIGQFMRPVVLANLIAWPIAFVAMRRWLGGFDDRIALSPLVFLGVALVAVVIATATIFAQSWRVARAEPAHALRYE